MASLLGPQNQRWHLIQFGCTFCSAADDTFQIARRKNQTSRFAAIREGSMRSRVSGGGRSSQGPEVLRNCPKYPRSMMILGLSLFKVGIGLTSSQDSIDILSRESTENTSPRKLTWPLKGKSPSNYHVSGY